MKEMKHRLIIIVLLLSFVILPISVEANDSINIWLDPLSYKTYRYHCEKGDILSGNIEVTLDGDYYIGDQQKYDLWVGWGDGIDFYIVNETSFDSTDVIAKSNPEYNRNDVTTLTWSLTIPSSGDWTIILDNDSSVYGKQIHGSITHQSPNQIFSIAVLLLGIGLVSVVSVLSIVKKRRML